MFLYCFKDIRSNGKTTKMTKIRGRMDPNPK